MIATTENEVACLTETQQSRAVYAVSLWMRTWFAKFGSNPTSADADHSALLRRLLSGKPMLKVSPPKRYSYPDYDLGEGKPVEVREISQSLQAGHLCIDQSGEWLKDWEHQDGTLSLIWEPTGERYLLQGKILKKECSISG